MATEPLPEGTSPNQQSGKTKLLDQWKAELRAGILYRTKFGRAKDWPRYKNMYRGFWDKGIIPVNIMYAIGRSMIPQVYFRNPRISISCKKPGYSMHAQVLERIDNYIIRETGLKQELKALALDCYLCGTGPIIIGYDTEFGFNPSFQSDMYADISGTNFNRKGERIEYQDNVHPGMPWALRCNPMDFIVPWGTHRWQEAPWFAFRKMRKLRDIQEDPKYSNLAGLKGSYKTSLERSEQSGSTSSTVQDDETKAEWVEIYQIHDKRTAQVFVLSLDHDKFLRQDDDYLQVEGLPADVLQFNEDTDYFWCPPDARMIEVQQEEINDIRTHAKIHRKLAVLKVIYDKVQLNKDELAKLLDGEPMAAVGIDVGTGGDIRKAVALFQSHVPPDFSTASREVREDIREIVGFSRNQSGAFEAPSGRRTAYEAQVVNRASMIRIDERRDITTDLLERVIRKENQLIFSNWTAERVVDIIGQDGARYWVKFTGKEIQGEFTYKINPEESVAADQSTRRQDAEKFLEIAAKIPGLNMPYIMSSYAEQFDWIDPKQLMPQQEGAGRSPERAMQFSDLLRKQGGGSQYPGLARG